MKCLNLIKGWMKFNFHLCLRRGEVGPEREKDRSIYPLIKSYEMSVQELKNNINFPVV